MTTRRGRERVDDRFRLLYESMRDAAATVDMSGQITDCNGVFESLLGYSADELRSMTYLDLTPEEWHAMEASIVTTQILSRGYSDVYRKEYRRKDGTVFPVELRTFLLRVSSGEPIGMWAIVRDITERKLAEDEMLRTQRLLKQTQEITKLGGWEFEVASQRTTWSDEVYKIYGVSRDYNPDDIQQNFRFFAPEDQSRISAAFKKAVEEGIPYDLEMRFIDAQGAKLWVRTSGQVEREEGHIKRVFGNIVDITAGKLVELREQSTRRVEAIGTLAAGIAHEINTPSQYVRDNLVFLNDSAGKIVAFLETLAQFENEPVEVLSPELKLRRIFDLAGELDLDFLRDEIPAALSDSLDGIKKISEIVRALKAFAHPGSPEKKAVELNKTIRDTVTVSRNEWKYVSDVEMLLDPALPLIACLGGEISQVLLNLILNAAHSIRDVVEKSPGSKGRITIRTTFDDKWGIIEVCDTGPGIPESIRDRVFDPFFTTKEVGKGSGQGLAISRAIIVEKHGGELSFETEIGRGTTFTIRLPLETF